MNDVLAARWVCLFYVSIIVMAVGLTSFYFSCTDYMCEWAEVKESVIIANYTTSGPKFYIEVIQVNATNVDTHYHCNASVSSLDAYFLGETLDILYFRNHACKVHWSKLVYTELIVGIVFLSAAALLCISGTIVVCIIHLELCCFRQEKKEEPVRQYEVFYNGER